MKRYIPAVFLPRFELAYCISVHKSQGSEFDRVIVLLPSESSNIDRKLLYTAITRARKKVEIWSTKTTLVQSIAKQTNRIPCWNFLGALSPNP